jgi:lipoprotein-anchoring transpeptidase ErfK/SrfK
MSSTMRRLTGSLAGLAAAAGMSLAVPALAHAETTGATPCAASARGCVDLSSQQAWLISNRGRVIDGPVPVATGKKSAPTTIGTFAVQWKDIDHHSHEFHGAPMPYSVFFHDGEAFHEGSLHQKSAGCVHLSRTAAQEFYQHLQPGDEVQIVR